ncbi:MAG: ATP-binding protein [Pseudonocardiaceae bacterium]
MNTPTPNPARSGPSAGGPIVGGDALAAALAAAADRDARRYVITGGPSSGKDELIEAILAAGIPCMEAEPGREIYRKHRERLGRHLRREDRHEYSLEVLQAFITEFTAHKNGIRFYNRGIPDGYGWDSFFGLGPTPQLEKASRLFRYDTVFVLDPLDTFEDPDDIIWAKDREIRRVHELIVQGYYDAGYEPVFVAPDDAAGRLDFLCSNLRLPKPIRERR